MVMRAWRKNNLRELRHSLGRWLAILAIVALGVGFFAGLKAARPEMLLSGEEYLNRTALYDFHLLTTLGLTQADVEAVQALDGVETAEGAVSVDAVRKVPASALPMRTASPKRTSARPCRSCAAPLTAALPCRS